ncbi:uncharacterized protein XM38_000960 [Halomicronema hongdechloris C2206]|uniref:DUF4278 domain-containing protein n=1 Tax=Halomicronema hongdechloris C2206 TaxID=1641165 RepID=A0A1Z3HFV9_9CYAN|nr:DUF4278 domain-containing protein [Halomicronema hongdechloris]ASC69170.1 uncharacterized protein XM38_000960 [Halomicronema hongdechloris C2206]
MKLCYRGVEYDYNPPMLEVTDEELQGCYRGRSLRFSYVRHIPIPQPVAEMTYRGIPYRTNSNGQVEPAATKPKSSLTLNLTSPMANPMAKARRQLLREAASAHRDNIQRSLQHRLEVARAQGNQALIQQLEDEMHQLTEVVS